MSLVSTISAGTTVRGSIRGEGDLEIHGRVEGVVAVTGDVLVSETALLKSDVRGRRVTVRGAVVGDVSAEEVIVLEPGARVLGDLGAPQIGIRAGGMVRGNVSTGGPLPETKSAAVATAAPATRGRVVAPPAARPAPARVVAPALPARPVAARPVAVRPEPPAARPVAAPVARPAVAARPEPLSSPSRAEPASSAAAHAGAMGDDDIEADEVEESGDGPPPPVVPALRKGAKASLRRKGAR